MKDGSEEFVCLKFKKNPNK